MVTYGRMDQSVDTTALTEAQDKRQSETDEWSMQHSYDLHEDQMPTESENLKEALVQFRVHHCKERISNEINDAVSPDQQDSPIKLSLSQSNLDKLAQDQSSLKKFDYDYNLSASQKLR